jgi:REP element-mobilizing transposase RayT
MAKSLSRILVHLVFSTKDQKLTLLNIQTDLYSYISAIFRNIECPIIAVGGAADHIHVWRERRTDPARRDEGSVAAASLSLLPELYYNPIHKP